MKKILMIVAVACMGNFGYAQTTAGTTAYGNTNRVVEGGMIVNSDKALNTDFSKYKTFGFASQVQTKNGLFFLNDYVLKNLIKHDVWHELETRGYDMAQQNPDLIVNFRVFDKPVEIKGFAGGTETGYWGTEEFRDVDSQRTYKLDAGSIIIQMADRTTGKMVWQGYASGITDGKVFDKDREKIAEAVSLIFNEYNNRADNLGNR